MILALKWSSFAPALYLEEVLPQIIHTGHSRYPVVGESTDDVLGILLAKDLLPFVLNPDKLRYLRATLALLSRRANVSMCF